MNKIYVLGIIVLFILISGCSKEQVNQSQITELANKQIIAFVGEEFFNKYITYDTIETFKLCYGQPSIEDCPHALEDYYRVKHVVEIPELEFEHKIHSDFNPQGEYVGSILAGPNLEFYSVLPNCTKNPDSCNFVIDKNKAIEIAKAEGIKESKFPWKISISDRKYGQTYAWRIESEQGKTLGEESQYIIIGVNNGKVWKQGENSFWDAV